LSGRINGPAFAEPIIRRVADRDVDSDAAKPGETSVLGGGEFHLHRVSGRRRGGLVPLAAELAGRSENLRIQGVIALRRIVHLHERLGAFINGPITIVIDPIGGLDGTRMDRGVGIDAVGVVGHVTRGLGGGHGRSRTALAVTVVIPVYIIRQRCCVLIDTPITIIVDVVVGLSDARMDSSIGVVAVAGLAYISSGRLRATRYRCRTVDTVAIAIGVAIPVGGGDAFVDSTDTVVVDTITNLDSAWVDRGLGVIAVAVTRDVPRRLQTSRLHTASAACPITIAIAIAIPDGDRGTVLVNAAIAVVVDAVTLLDGARIDAGFGVIAVPRDRRPNESRVVRDFGATGRRGSTAGTPVPIVIQILVQRVEGQTFVGAAIAVIVGAVAGLGGAGIDGGIAIIAVHVVVETVVIRVIVGRCRGRGGDWRRRGGRRSGVIAVEIAAVAVLIHTILTDLESTGIGRGIVVVAVDLIGATIAVDVLGLVVVSGSGTGRDGLGGMLTVVDRDIARTTTDRQTGKESDKTGYESQARKLHWNSLRCGGKLIYPSTRQTPGSIFKQAFRHPIF